MAFKADQKVKICEKLAEGRTIREVCRLPGMPTHVTIYRWASKDRDFAEALQRAREQSYLVPQSHYKDLEKSITCGGTRTELHRLRALKWELDKRGKVLARNRFELVKRWR